MSKCAVVSSDLSFLSRSFSDFSCWTCHLEVPTHSIDDIVSLETSFHALPTSVDAVDEIDMIFVGPTVT